jgi:K+-transporting ATPase ATPase C chain
MHTATHVSVVQLIRPAFAALLLFTIVTGVVYPALVTGVAQGLFSSQANGSLITTATGEVLGSRLIGQQFDQPAYFWGRLSATGPFPYNSAASGGSNLGPLNPALVGPEGAIQARMDALQAADAAANVSSSGPIPIDLVTASGSGLDPHISPAAANFQAARVAAVRGLEVGDVKQLIAAHTEGRELGILGEPRVNVLLLNLALDGAQ